MAIDFQELVRVAERLVIAERRVAELEAALRVLVDGYYSDDESVPTLEHWDTARELLKTK